MLKAIYQITRSHNTEGINDFKSRMFVLITDCNLCAPLINYFLIDNFEPILNNHISMLTVECLTKSILF